MKDKFYELPEEKQLRIINAALEVFSQNEYKRAVTDDIAAKAQISKGLLFYYFNNKRELYMFLWKYCESTITEEVIDGKFYEITDFFELVEYSAMKKAKVLVKTPYIMDFVMRAYYSEKEEVSEDVCNDLGTIREKIFDNYLKNIDTTKFKEGLKVNKIYDMVVWMMDGYLHEKQQLGMKLTVEDLMAEFKIWLPMFKSISYKEEYLNERN